MDRRIADDDPFVAQLLSAARRDTASEDSRARAIAIATTGASVGVVASGAKSSIGLLTAKVSLVVLAVSGAALLATPHSEPPPAPPSPPTAVVEVHAAAPVAASAVAPVVELPVSASAPRVVQKKVAPPPPPSASAPAPIDDSAAELAMVSSAHAALKAGDATTALARIAAWRKQFTGHFAEEAEAIHVDALVASGAKSAAAKHAEAFVNRWPKSLHAARMRAVAP